jgi:hypothetical protein
LVTTFAGLTNLSSYVSTNKKDEYNQTDITIMATGTKHQVYCQKHPGIEEYGQKVPATGPESGSVNRRASGQGRS